MHARCDRRALLRSLSVLQGAEVAIQAAARLFGAELPQRLPRLWEEATAALLERPPGQLLTFAPTADPQVCIVFEHRAASQCAVM